MSRSSEFGWRGWCVCVLKAGGGVRRSCTLCGRNLELTTTSLSLRPPSIEYNISYVYHAMSCYFAR